MRAALITAVACGAIGLIPTTGRAWQRPEQNPVAVVRVRVVQPGPGGDTLPVERAAVRAGNIARLTDARGLAELRVAAGEYLVTVGRIGFAPESLMVTLAVGVDTTLQVWLAQRSTELEAVIVVGEPTGFEEVLAQDVPGQGAAIHEEVEVGPHGACLAQQVSELDLLGQVPGDHRGGLSRGRDDHDTHHHKLCRELDERGAHGS